MIIADNVRVVVHQTDTVSQQITIGKYAQVKFLHYPISYTPGTHEYVFILQEGSVLECTHLFLATQELKISLKIILQGAHARATVHGLCILTKAQHIEINTTQMHEAPHTKSTIMMRGLLTDSAYARFDGLITITQEASKTDAALENKNFLLSPSARVQSVPSLQVLTNDVRCAHGSATGYLNPEQLWYLKTRGLNEVQAQQFLVHSFLAPITETIDDMALQEAVGSAIQQILFEEKEV